MLLGWWWGELGCVRGGWVVWERVVGGCGWREYWGWGVGVVVEWVAADWRVMNTTCTVWWGKEEGGWVVVIGLVEPEKITYTDVQEMLVFTASRRLSASDTWPKGQVTWSLTGSAWLVVPHLIGGPWPLQHVHMVYKGVLYGEWTVCDTYIAHYKYCGAMQSAISHSFHPDLQNMYWCSNVRGKVRQSIQYWLI